MEVAPAMKSLGDFSLFGGLRTRAEQRFFYGSSNLIVKTHSCFESVRKANNMLAESTYDELREEVIPALVDKFLRRRMHNTKCKDNAHSFEMPKLLSLSPVQRNRAQRIFFINPWIGLGKMRELLKSIIARLQVPNSLTPKLIAGMR